MEEEGRHLGHAHLPTAPWSRRSRGRAVAACSRGVYTSVSEIGDAENISKSYVSRILRLALLAPDIIDAILAGGTDQSLVLEKLERPLPASWRSSASISVDAVLRLALG
jgi:hypothetical protein